LRGRPGRHRGGQRGLAVVDVADGADVDVWFGSCEYALCHVPVSSTAERDTRRRRSGAGLPKRLHRTSRVPVDLTTEDQPPTLHAAAAKTAVTPIKGPEPEPNTGAQVLANLCD